MKSFGAVAICPVGLGTMAIQLLLCALIVIALAHVATRNIPNWAFLFLPIIYLAPAVFHVELTTMLGWLGLILIVAGSVATYFGDKAADNEKDERTKSRLTAVAGIGFAATMLGAVMAFVDQVKSDGKNEAAQEEIQRLGRENIQLSKENTAKQEQITNLITGGDSRLYLRFENTRHGKPRVNYAVLGEHDIPNADIDYFRVPSREEVGMSNDPESLDQATSLL